MPDVSVDTAFKSKFPTATFVQWSQIDVLKWQANFVYEKKEQISLFDSMGNWLETSTPLPFQTIPVRVQESFKKKHNISGLQNIYHIQTPNSSIFQMQWSDGVLIKKLLFNNLGKTIGKIMTHGSHQAV